MSNFLRYASLGAALLTGTAAAHAQTVIVQDPGYVAPAYAAPAPAYVAPRVVAVPAAPAYVAPAPGVVVAQPPVVAQTPVIAQPAPVTQEIVAQPQTVVTQPRERVQETVIQRSETQPAIRRHAHTTRVHLTSRQRREVLRTIRYERTEPAVQRRIATTPVSYSIGSVLPATVPTYAMPREVVYEAPALRSYAYAPLGDRVLLVEPASNVVVDELR
jgi:hypothetical protein